MRPLQPLPYPLAADPDPPLQGSFTVHMVLLFCLLFIRPLQVSHASPTGNKNDVLCKDQFFCSTKALRGFSLSLP